MHVTTVCMDVDVEFFALKNYWWQGGTMFSRRKFFAHRTVLQIV